MRIALDLSGVDIQTGVSVYVKQLLYGLQQFENKNEFILIMRKRDVPVYSIFAKNFRVFIIPNIFEPALLNIIWHWTLFPFLLHKLNVDLLHQMDINRISIIRNTAYIVTVHGLIDSKVSGRRLLFRQFYNSVIVPKLIRLPVKIISVSNNTKKDVMEIAGLDESKISVIHEGCIFDLSDQINKSESITIIKNKYGLDEGYILYVARIEHPNKNHLQLLKAYKLLCEQYTTMPNLVFVGGASYRSDIVREAIQNFVFNNKIKLTGFVPDEDLVAFYKCASVYVCPALYEGFGLPLLEAMRFGVPIVCSGSSSMPEVVGKAALTFDPRDVNSIYEAILKVLNNSAVKDALIYEGRMQLKKFNVNEMALRTFKTYYSVFHRNPDDI